MNPSVSQPEPVKLTVIEHTATKAFAPRVPPRRRRPFADAPHRECCPHVGEERDTEAGQVSGGYAIVVGTIALVCVLAALFLGIAIRGQFQSVGVGVQQAPFQPPIPSSELSWPATLAECEDGGWQNYTQFATEVECVEYIDNRAP